MQTADRVDENLQRLGLMSVMPICSEQVGCDMENRASEGVNVLEVNLLAGEIAQMGWSWDACRHATCLEQMGMMLIRPRRSKFSSTRSAVCTSPISPFSLKSKIILTGSFGSVTCSGTVLEPF